MAFFFHRQAYSLEVCVDDMYVVAADVEYEDTERVAFCGDGYVLLVFYGVTAVDGHGIACGQAVAAREECVAVRVEAVDDGIERVLSGDGGILLQADDVSAGAADVFEDGVGCVFGRGSGVEAEDVV